MAPTKNEVHPNLKTELLRALDKEIWKNSAEVRPHVKTKINPTYLGRALRALVRVGLADVKLKGERAWYRLGTGQTFQEKPEPEPELDPVKVAQQYIDAHKQPVATLTPMMPTSTPSQPKLPTPTVIPAGKDYLVFGSLAKIRVLGPERVLVFYNVVGDNYNLTCDEYEGEAARNVIEAFEQRLYGWISTKMVEDLRTKLRDTEADCKQRVDRLLIDKEALEKEVGRLKKKLRVFKQELEKDED